MEMLVCKAAGHPPHRQDAPDLPRLRVANRTVGRTHTGGTGCSYRPSMLVTLTLGSHGPVHIGARHHRGAVQPCDCGQLHGQRDPLLGIPLDPDTYDYRGAALDAIHFARLLDRWWQNLRRAVDWKLQ
jgi:replication initiator protein RepSA